MSEVAEAAHTALASARAGGLERAWSELEPALRHVGSDRAAALAFAQLLMLDPTRTDALPYAERIVAGLGTDPQVVIALSAALLHVAERRPPDEPPFEQGPAHLAAAACQACFDTLDSSARTNPEIGGYLKLNLADGLRMMGPDHDSEALQAYQLALAIDDSKGAWWFHLGLLHKWRGRFREGLEANQKALARMGRQFGSPLRVPNASDSGGVAAPRPGTPPSTERTSAADSGTELRSAVLGAQRAVLWNTAICATALGEGGVALDAWRKIGVEGELTPAGMPLVPDMPAMQVRVATLGEEIGRNDPLPADTVTFEVVWVQPFSPCHGVVQSPTARKASVDFGDVVLWDGAPVRVHQVGGRVVPVFPLLWVLRAGDERRLRFVGMQKRRGMIEELATELGEDVHLVAFDQRASAAGDGHLFYGKLVVGGGRDLGSVREALERGLSARAGLTLAVPQLYELLGDTQAAGKAHQAWGGIERAAQKQGLLPPRR